MQQLIKSQKISISINKHKLQNLDISDTNKYKILIDKTLFNQDYQSIVINNPNAVPVSSLAPDTFEHRSLGIGLSDLSLNEIDD